MISQNKRLTYILLSIPFILLIPNLAMKFTDQVDWSPTDFLVMGILLLVAGLASEFVLRVVKKTQHRILFVGAVLLLFLLVWAELAVGIFGTPLAGS